MELSLTLMTNIAAMLIWCGVGFLIVRIGLLSYDDNKVVSSLCVYVMTPCVLICAFQIELTEERLFAFLSAFVFAMIVHTAWIILAWLVRKIFKLSSIDQMTLVYTNCGNLIIPLISMTLGSEMVFYTSSYMLAFSIFIWTHGISVVKSERAPQLKKILLNPNLIAIEIGLCLMAFGIKLPGIVYTAMNGLGSMIGPASMISIGMVIGGTELKSVFANRKAYMISLGRLIILPLLTILGLWATGICKRWPVLIPVMMVAFLAAAAPSSTSITNLAVVYDNHARESGIYNVMTTLFCIFTLPLMLLIYQLVIG